MRDPKRIEEMTSVIKNIWYQVPDLRLGQLLINCTHDLGTDLFYVEDDVLLQRLKDYAKKVKETYLND